MRSCFEGCPRAPLFLFFMFTFWGEFAIVKTELILWRGSGKGDDAVVWISTKRKTTGESNPAGTVRCPVTLLKADAAQKISQAEIRSRGTVCGGLGLSSLCQSGERYVVHCAGRVFCIGCSSISGRGEERSVSCHISHKERRTSFLP